MSAVIGIRREDKSVWERRTPLIPANVNELSSRFGIKIIVQPSEIRVFNDSEFRSAGAIIQEDLSECDIVFGVKEMPVSLFKHGGIYMFFSHTIKGQKKNMAMLQHLMNMQCTLIDYERIFDETGKRLVFFGKYAGLAGMIDTLWAFGQRLKWEGMITPFAEIRKAYEYDGLGNAKKAISDIAARIRANPLQKELHPLVFGFTGYGNVSLGAQEIFDIFPHKTVSPEALPHLSRTADDSKEMIKVVFREEHTVRSKLPGSRFDKNDFFAHPDRYETAFTQYLDHLSVLVNCIYWNAGAPMLLSYEDCKRLWEKGKQPRLRVIGDISCDIEGGIQCTTHSTQPDNPVYVYDVNHEATVDGFDGHGPVIMAVDNLPCELPAESSVAFSEALMPLLRQFIKNDMTAPFESLSLPKAIKDAIILYQGKFPPGYTHMAGYLNQPRGIPLSGMDN